jgi:hypothetical protein
LLREQVTSSTGTRVLGEGQLPWVVYLDPEDDIVSICDRLDWHTGPRLALVLPIGADLLTDYLDQVRLRRYAQALRLEVGLVTRDRRVRSAARGLSLPLFATVDDSLNKERVWRRARSRRVNTRPVPRIELDQGDLAEIRQRKQPRSTLQQWLLRYLAIVVYFLTLAVMLVAAVYLVPGGTITLKPEVVPLQVSKQIVADPQLQSAEESGSSVPGRVLVTTTAWQAQVQTTGTVEVADAAAEGTIVFVNRLAQPVTVPAGTRVSTTAGKRVVFQTLETVELPGEAAAMAEVRVVAIEPGEEGNVAANQINLVEGALGLQLQVRNLEPLTGGSLRLESAVASQDQERLRAQLLQQLQALAVAEMEAMLGEGEFLARDSVRISRILAETYSHFPGERAGSLTMELRAEVEATAVNRNLANGLVYAELAETLPSGFELVQGSLAFRSGRVIGVDGDGRVTFEMLAEGLATARMDLDQLLPEISGQEIGVARAYLYENLRLRDYPEIRVWPAWLGRLPYLPIRIQTEVVTS